MTFYTYNYATAHQVCVVMASVTSNMKSQLEFMDAAVKSTLADWVDGASAAYEAAKAEWNAAAAHMPVSLGSAQSTLDHISGGYKDMENAGIKTWGDY
ncbi:Proteins of 100 residues with WXG [Actinokineospora alba]|uniref:Proteins of 100 residues with WXG n=1 Tax=Actinokineospora alba TaxID=504798 RepID=A0A1H0WM92_9PSEU|nr:WXG100 family type VII secretion target [Actinokineospora alba]TDP67180.1 type VII secretion system (Wss) protein ESAT-6 [Actinokineospora alba]SDJ54679.1 Proteins of 100 residues with WXG [Actinokineospora alba]SDP91753.1 Proteins of 100 residues with WXG [Actinokineospora alba]